MLTFTWAVAPETVSSSGLGDMRFLWADICCILLVPIRTGTTLARNQRTQVVLGFACICLAGISALPWGRCKSGRAGTQCICVALAHPDRNLLGTSHTRFVLSRTGIFPPGIASHFRRPLHSSGQPCTGSMWLNSAVVGTSLACILRTRFVLS